MAAMARSSRAAAGQYSESSESGMAWVGLIAWAPASTIARARYRLWLWLPLISVITKGACSTPMGRPAISIVMG